MATTAVIIVAGGGGSRMGGMRPKQFMLLDGIPILARTINRFAEALPGARIVVVLPAAHIDFWNNLAARFEVKPHTIVEGGSERFHSVRRGLAAIGDEVELIAIQDGVRPLGSCEMIRRVSQAAEKYGAAIPVVEPVDSFRQTEGMGIAPSQVTDRSKLRIVQTPQIFRAQVLQRAYDVEFREEFTDDASVAEAAGQAIFLCEGEASNIKITRPEDLTIAQALLAAEEQEREQTCDGEHL